MDDFELIQRIGRGDTRAMRVLYERHNGAVYAFAMSRAKNAELASDCVHDTMMEVWRNASRFGERSSVRTWLFAIARNKLVDALRKRGRISYVEDVPETEDPAPSPEAAAIAAAERARLQHCLGGLSGPHAAAIRLAFFEELTYPEVAEIEGVPVGTIKTRIFHAKQALMRCLEKGLRKAR
ncbi:RNA polymerase sigma factor [Dinoroseobacter sp. S76]|uniref:RNA polymerase sigma factor n=1 Tax=Dinoroseobacter sp. S76 TaxID=3415124 RepID=UPI003C7BE0C4